MIYEERIYRLKPGKVPEYFDLYEKEGMAIQVPILGKLIGYFQTEIGPLNQVIHIWAYESLEDRAARRAKLAKSSAWQAYLTKVRALVEVQENRILLPASFSPLK